MTKACALIGPFRGGPEKDPSWGRIFFGVGVSTVWGFRSISYFGDSLRKGQTKKFKGGGVKFLAFSTLCYDIVNVYTEPSVRFEMQWLQPTS